MQEQDDARTDARSTRSKDRSTRRKPRLLGTAVAVAVVVALALGVVVAAAHDDRQRRVNLFGDSLVRQASPYWLDLMHRAGWDAQQSSYAGTNTCDWFAQMRNVAKRRHPDVVALSFGGNDITKCMHHADGSKLSRTEFLAKFRRDTETAVGIFGNRVRIYLVAPPAMFDGDDRFGPAYRAVAAEHRT
ncbi:MAG: hypothetical protein QOI55_2267, partial [Actinomycetota bacterium]|nr:hypothetical protein [Actinomycetota bacterium]